MQTESGKTGTGGVATAFFVFLGERYACSFICTSWHVQKKIATKAIMINKRMFISKKNPFVYERINYSGL